MNDPIDGWPGPVYDVPPLSAEDVQEAWQKTLDSAGRNDSRGMWSRIPQRPWMQIAVGLGIMVVAGALWWHLTISGGAREEYATSPGQRMTVRLVDGTQVILAPESRLQVPAGYGRLTRETVLDGQAYFSVVHNALHPFAVRAGPATITDVGTKFDVRAYGDDRDVRVGVAEGSVKLAVGGASSSALSVGDMANVSDAGVTVYHQANMVALAAWRQGRLVFNAVPLVQVARDLERTFGLTITIRDSVLARQTVTASFDNERADEVLDVVTAVVGASYVREGTHIVIRRPATAERQQQAPVIPSEKVAQAAVGEQ